MKTVKKLKEKSKPEFDFITIKLFEDACKKENVDPAKLPGKFFKSKATAQALKELSGDPAFAEKAARSHIAVETSGFRTGEEVTDYIRKNHDWLQEFPDLENKLSQIAGSHRVGRALRTLGTWGAGAAVGTGALGVGKSILGGF